MSHFTRCRFPHFPRRPGAMTALLFTVQAVFGCAAPPGHVDDFAKRAGTVEEHYARWVGVSAPEIGAHARDRVIGPPIELKGLRGKRVLLLGITGAGDFVNAPDRSAFAATLEAVKKAREEHGEKLAVVGFTKSLNPGLPAEVPVVQVTNRTFREPYELLLGGLGWSWMRRDRSLPGSRSRPVSRPAFRSRGSRSRLFCAWRPGRSWLRTRWSRELR
ncbi:MAG TPA: hypothetical protein VMT52_14840 [Planctomycetota bacterium]|nr:hypothetical protein [Planctomycetota bacterium]